jgi:U4/U6.U5 tri-snRNP-associated protein 3
MDSRRRRRRREKSPDEREVKKVKSSVNKDGATTAPGHNGPTAPPAGNNQDNAVALDAELSAEEIQMMMAMGIPFGFDSTQGKHVDDTASNQGAVKVATKRSARQYMNRKGGFNKALPAERTGDKVHIEGYARR